jgi:hypothetical protein
LRFCATGTKLIALLHSWRAGGGMRVALALSGGLLEDLRKGLRLALVGNSDFWIPIPGTPYRNGEFRNSRNSNQKVSEFSEYRLRSRQIGFPKKNCYLFM